MVRTAINHAVTIVVAGLTGAILGFAGGISFALWWLA